MRKKTAAAILAAILLLPIAVPAQQVSSSGSALTIIPAARQDRGRAAAPAVGLKHFGENLFQGKFSAAWSDSAGGDYVIAPGDRLSVRSWGMHERDETVAVDQQGNIFVPEIGPVKVGGVRSSGLMDAVKAAAAKAFPEGVPEDRAQVYVSLQGAQPVAVYVAGFVSSPGRYAGTATESLISFIDRAGGIDPERGSWRHVEVKRAGRRVLSCDLYRFALEGEVSRFRLQDGDVIHVKEKGVTVAVRGLVRESAIYEFSSQKAATGRGLESLASPLKSVTHVSVTGTRKGEPFSSYLTLAAFRKFSLHDGDAVEFVADAQGETILASISGAVKGSARVPVKKTVRLREFLRHVEIVPELAAVDCVYVRRSSVAADQKEALDDSLRRLERALSAAPSVEGAKIVRDFIRKALRAQPEGIIVVAQDGAVSDIMLENGDEIVVPQKSDVVQVSGAVVMAKSVAFAPTMSPEGYIAAAGGFSGRADRDLVLVARPSGEVGSVSRMGVRAGDRILVLPKVDAGRVPLAKEVQQVMYQVAAATGEVIDF